MHGLGPRHLPPTPAALPAPLGLELENQGSDLLFSPEPGMCGGAQHGADLALWRLCVFPGVRLPSPVLLGGFLLAVSLLTRNMSSLVGLRARSGWD